MNRVPISAATLAASLAVVASAHASPILFARATAPNVDSSTLNSGATGGTRTM